MGSQRWATLNHSAHSSFSVVVVFVCFFFFGGGGENHLSFSKSPHLQTTGVLPYKALTRTCDYITTLQYKSMDQGHSRKLFAKWN